MAGPASVYLGKSKLETKKVISGLIYTRVHKDHTENGEPAVSHAKWALSGLRSDRLPTTDMRDQKPEFAMWRNHKVKNSASQLIIDIPMYIEAVLRSERSRTALESLLEAWKNAKECGKSIALLSPGGYNHLARKLTLNQVACNEKHMDHAFVLAMILEGTLFRIVEEESLRILGEAPPSQDLPTDFSRLRADERRMDISSGGARVFYRSKCLNRLSSVVLEALRPGGSAEIPWQQYTFRKFGHECKEHKLSAFFGDPDTSYRYVGVDHRGRPWDEDKSGVLRMCLFIVKLITAEDFNFVLLNWYRGKKDSLGDHSDDERDLVVGSSIASLTVGMARPFKFTPRGEARARGPRKYP